MKAAAALKTSVDEVQELIVQVEQILETLEHLGDARSGQLRDRFRRSVVAARARMLDAQEAPVPVRSRALASSQRLAIAALTGLTLGLLIALPARSP